MTLYPYLLFGIAVSLVHQHRGPYVRPPVHELALIGTFVETLYRLRTIQLLQRCEAPASRPNAQRSME